MSDNNDILNDNLNDTRKIVSIRIVISSDLVSFAIVVGKFYMSGCWCHLCHFFSKILD